MRRFAFVRLCFLAAGLSACSELKLPPGRPRALPVTVEPVGDLSRAPAVLRLRLSGALGRSALSDFAFFSGSLSDYYLKRIAARELPETLARRKLDTLVWADGKDVVVAPTRALSTGAYTLATPELGAVAELEVDATLVPWLARTWPPPADASGSGFSVFCGEQAQAAATGGVTLEPSGNAAEVARGVDVTGAFAESCLRLEPSGAASTAAPELPPALVGGVGLEPLPLVRSGGALPAPVCTNAEVALGPGCATLDDDRLVVRSAGEPSLWAFEQPEELLAVASAGASVVLHGLASGRSTAVTATAFDRAGARTAVDVMLTGGAPHAHVVLNEVLANPRGPEAASEWIELANDGAEAAELGGFELRDEGGSVTLPPFRLEPGELVLLVADGFAPDAELDVPPAPGTRVLTLPELGHGALTNAGELLRLSDTDGRVLSRFPALSATTPGVSVARRTPDAPDDDATAFAAHGPPGASPGAPNVFAPE